MEEDIKILEKIEIQKEQGCKLLKCKIVDKNIELNKKLIDLKKNSIPKSKIKEIRDKAEVMDYYVLGDVIEDLNKLLGDEK